MGPASKGPTVAVFASQRGPGDPERSSIMSQAGSYFARHGARIACLVDGTAVPVPLIVSARAAGGAVTVIADPGVPLPPSLMGVEVERLADPEERMARLAALAQCFVGLPGSLASATSLYSTWTLAGGGNSGKPVVLYNRNRAFEVLRGYIADVVAHSLKRSEQVVQFADSIEDTWSRVVRMVGA